ncbi:MAG: FKBP-type peptidyl-prolyl cis-trans isomerase [Candidatus Altiarchaeota archaeon]
MMEEKTKKPVSRKKPKQEDETKSKDIVIEFDMKRIMNLVILLVLILVTGFVIKSMISSPDTGQTKGLPDFIIKSQTIQTGDLVKISYAGSYLNGTVFDTSDPMYAQEVGIYNPQRQYNPISAKVGSGQLIKGLEDAFIGLEVGQEKTVTLSPAQAYGQIDPLKRIVQPLSKSVPREESVPIEIVTQIIEDAPYIGQVFQFPDASWNMTVLQINESHVLVRNEIDEPLVVPTEFGQARIEPGEENLTVTLIGLEEGVPVPTPIGYAVIRDIGEENFTLDYNHPLAGETLIFKIKVEEILR